MQASYSDRCTSCGAELEDGDRFCTDCGSPVTDRATSEPTLVRAATAATAPPHAAPSASYPPPPTHPPPPAPPPAPPVQPQLSTLPPPQAPYAPGYDTTPAGTNGYAIASLVLGIVWIAGLGSLLAVIFGVMAKNQIDASGGRQTGRGLAVAGLVLGVVGLIGLIIWIILIAAVSSSTPTYTY